MLNVLITGGSGLVGKQLSNMLRAKGYKVDLLSRNTTGEGSYYWDPGKPVIDEKAIDTADYIVHLAGAGISEKRWTAKRKKEIIDSRVETANLLFEKVKERKKKLKAFISASAIGYYGMITSKKIFTESDPPAHDFLGETCSLWEQAADRFKNDGVRTVKIRTGIVLAENGGALAKMIPPVKMGIGSALGSGRQYMPCIHIDDLCGIYLKAIEDERMEGAYNAVAPEHCTNKELVQKIAEALHKPLWFPNVPSFVIKIMFGEMSEMILRGSRVSSDRIRTAGYTFLFPDITGQLRAILGKQV